MFRAKSVIQKPLGRLLLVSLITLLAAKPLWAITTSNSSTGTSGGTSSSTTTTSTTSGASDNIETLLTLIWANTNAILADIDGIPAFIQNLTAPDNSSNTATFQNQAASATAAHLNEYQKNIALQQKLMGDFFGPTITSATLPNANDLTYETVLNQLYFNPDPRQATNNQIDPAYNYTQNAAGLNITHATPSPQWRGSKTALARYTNYYNTIMAVQTFGAWVMGQNYTNLKLGFPFESQQWSLMSQASSSSWFQQVASENIGLVLRQILMYDSQIFVTLTQLVQGQQQQLTAQAMANTLLVLDNLSNENYMVKVAQGQIQGG